MPPAVDRAANLETVLTGVKRRRPAAAPLAVVGLAVALATACSQPPKPAPVDAAAYWPTALGDPSRAPFANQTVSTRAPQVAWESSVGPGLRAMPVATDEVIVAASADRHIYVVSRVDGSQLWRHKLKGEPLAPLLRADEIYTATESHGFFYVLHMTEGKELRTFELPSTGGMASMSGDTAFIATDNGQLLAVSPRSDDPLWTARFRRPPSTGPIVFAQWVVYVAHDSLFAVNRTSGSRLAAVAAPGPITGEVASDRRALFAATESGSLVAWRLPDLARLWQANGFDPFVAGPAVADSLGYAATGTGRLVRFKLADGSASEFAAAGGPVIATPSLVSNGLIVGDLNGRLHFLSLNGQTVWTVDFDGSLDFPVIVSDDRIIVPYYSRKGIGLASTTHARITELR